MSSPTDRPRFSFITTAYGTAEVIGSAIDSVLAQTKGDWELVVVDNGCDDAIAAAVALRRPPGEMVRQENRGTEEVSPGLRAKPEASTSASSTVTTS